MQKLLAVKLISNPNTIPSQTAINKIFSIKNGDENVKDLPEQASWVNLDLKISYVAPSPLFFST